MVYLNEILIYSKDLATPKDDVYWILRKLQENKTAVVPEKYEWNKTKLEFLAHIISTNSPEMCTDKIDAIQRQQPPKNLRDVQYVLEFAIFYRYFISDYSNIAKPIQQLTYKDSKFQWTAECQGVFEQLKSAFVYYPVFRHFDATKQIIIETDASDYVVSAIISQYFENQLDPIAFYFRKMSPAECNHVIGDKEILAIIEAFSVQRNFIEEAKHLIEVITDDKNLQEFTIAKPFPRRQFRWYEQLARFDFIIRYHSE